MMPPGVLLVIFLSVTFFVVGLLYLVSGSRGKEAALLQSRLDYVLGEVPDPTPAKPTKASLFREDFIRGSPLLTLLHRGFPRLKDFRSRLEQAGVTMSGARFVQIAVLLTLMGGFLGWAYSRTAVALFLGAALGAWIPFLFLKLKRRARMKAFEKQFPEALRLLATSLRAGHALAASIRILGEELPAPVGAEFQKVAEESNLGLSIEDALQNLLGRMDNPDLRFFVTAVLIQRETGGNLATILQNLDQLIRERFKIRGQVKALTAPGRLTGMILAVLPLGVGGIMVLINPLYMEPLWKTGTGRGMAILSFILQIMGYFMIRKIVNIRY